MSHSTSKASYMAAIEIQLKFKFKFNMQARGRVKMVAWEDAEFASPHS